MYPFRREGQWWLAGRHVHVARIARGVRLRADLQRDLDRCLLRIKAWGCVKVFLMALLSLGLLATAVAFVARAIPALSHLGPLLRSLSAAAGTSTGLVAAAYLFTNRVLGQLEVDILGLLATSERIDAEN